MITEGIVGATSSICVTGEILASQQPVDSTIYWVAKFIYQNLAYISSTCLSKVKDFYLDEEKEWKILKFDLSLNIIAKAFEESSPLEVLKTTFENDDRILSIIELLLKSNSSSINEAFYDHQTFIDLLREALKENSHNSEEFLSRICLYRFTEGHIFPFCAATINEIVLEGMKALQPNSQTQELVVNLSQIPLKDQFLYIHAAPLSFKDSLLHIFTDLVRGGLNVGFDAQRSNNIPYVLFDFVMDSTTIRVLRSGSPTRQRYNYETYTYEGKAEIIPEFENFINTLKKNEETMLYVSCQDSIPRSFGTEHERNNALIEFHQNNPKTFKLAIFAHDTFFFFQNFPYDAPQVDAFEFRNEFLAKMKSTTDGFFFSEGLFDEDAIIDIMNEVHFDLFQNKSILNREERCNFIELTYTRLTLYFLKQTKAKYLINSCKDTADRAAVRNALLQLVLLIFFKKETSESHLNALYTFLHAGAFFVKKRALNSRKERFISMMKLLESDEIRANLQFRKQAIGVEGHDLFIRT